jgi:putative hemolysin
MIITAAMHFKIALLWAGIGLIAFFSSAEISLTSLNTINLKNLKHRFRWLAPMLSFWEERPNDILAAVLIGTNLAIVAVGVVGTSLAIDWSAASGISQGKAITVISATTILLTIFLGELAPKIISRYYPEVVSVAALPILMVFCRIFAPVSALLINISEKVIHLFGGSKTAKETPFIQQEELKVLLTMDDTIPLSRTARNILGNMLEFGSTKISRIMVPRPEIQAVNIEQPPSRVIEQIIEKGYSRVPVYKGSMDNIIGIIFSRDLALAMRDGSLFVIDDLVRPAYFVPENARIDKVLRDFKTGHYHMALVVDEFGATIGLATIEDIVEEIVGEIWDEYDIQAKTIVALPDGSYSIKASEPIDKVNTDLALGLPDGEYNTVGGWVLDLFGRIPKTGEKITSGPIAIEVEEADKRKVIRVKIKKA